MKRIEIITRENTELVDITDKIKEIVRNEGAISGICVVFTKHTTTGLIINENEAGLRSDIIALLNELIPKGGGYMHDRIDNNAHSHLRAMILSSSVCIPIDQANLMLGRWQSILFVECDGPRKREVYVKVIQ